MISVKILADSINPLGIRLTSWLLVYPRFIHSEFMTHRVFSRNAASSRAIPFQKLLAAIQENPAMPEYWGEELKGMASGKAISGDRLNLCDATWRLAAKQAIGHANEMADASLHKSLCNRLIENFGHITVLATASDHRNFFSLRAHPAAMPEFQVLAYRMLAAYHASTPSLIAWGDWHIPEFKSQPKHGIDVREFSDRLKIATARCARLSYLTFDGEYAPEKDIELHDRLLSSGHMSPFEHCAQATPGPESEYGYSLEYWLEKRSNFDDNCRLFCGWTQYRKTIENENRTHLSLDDILSTKPDWITT